jgi:methionyl-tRNA formyltransferase
MTLRIIFMGTPDFATPTLAAIAGQGHEIAAVYTRAPAPAGRGMAPRLSPVHTMAERFGWPVFTPATLKGEEETEQFRAHQADVAVIVAYGRILPKSFLEAPKQGCLNLHASLLPRWRGAAPIARAILAGDAISGVCVMRMEEGLDTGPVAMAEQVLIPPDLSAGALHDSLKVLGADLMVRALAALSRDALTFRPQPDEGITYATKITNDESRIDWTRPGEEIVRRICALSPYPSAFCEVSSSGKGENRLRILQAENAEGSGKPGELLDLTGRIACGTAAVRLLRVQKAGRTPLSMEEYLRGARCEPGQIFL